VKNRKSIWNHERGGRTVEKHAETEATEKSSKQFQSLPGREIHLQSKVDGPGDRLTILTAE
jgi:hypothetical protein